MSVTSPTEPPTGNGPPKAPMGSPQQAVPDYQGFSPLVEAKESWLTILLRTFAPIPAGISRWPPPHLIALFAVVALTYVATQVLAAREALGPLATLVGVVAAV